MHMALQRCSRYWHRLSAIGRSLKLEFTLQGAMTLSSCVVVLWHCHDRGLHQEISPSSSPCLLPPFLLYVPPTPSTTSPIRHLLPPPPTPSHTLPPRPIPHPLSVGVKCFHQVFDGPIECLGYFCTTIIYIKDAMAEPVSVNHCINSTRFCLSEVFMNHDGFLYKIFGCCTTDYCNRNLSTAGLPLNYTEYLTRKPLSSESVHMYVHTCVCTYICMSVCVCQCCSYYCLASN